MAIRILRDLPEEPWRDFVENNPDGNIFHTPEMYEVFIKTEKYSPEVWAAMEGEEVLALLLPVTVRILGFPFHRLSMRKVIFGGVLYAHTPRGFQALDSLLAAYAKHPMPTSSFTEVRNISDTIQAREIFEKNGFKFIDQLNFLIPLSPNSEEMLLGFKKRLRKQIRRGITQKSVQTREIFSISELETCYSILSSTYKRARVPLPEISLFSSLLTHLGPAGMVRITLSTVNQKPAATSIDLLYKDKIIGWYGGTDRSFGKVYPTEMIVWDLLHWGGLNGYAQYDFGGAGSPDEESGVREFKSKFGGELVNYGRYHAIHTPLLFNLSKAGYRLYQKLIPALTYNRR